MCVCVCTSSINSGKTKSSLCPPFAVANVYFPLQLCTLLSILTASHFHLPKKVLIIRLFYEYRKDFCFSICREGDQSNNEGSMFCVKLNRNFSSVPCKQQTQTVAFLTIKHTAHEPVNVALPSWLLFVCSLHASKYYCLQH
jgi:hypothetical protein